MSVNTENQKQWSAHRARQERSRKASETAYRALAKMTPKDRLYAAQSILTGLVDDGISYADFQSAQAVERYVKRAAKNLEGLG